MELRTPGIAPNTAAEPLRLRRWTFNVLFGEDRVADQGLISSPPEVAPHSWSTFLRSERCASALIQAIDRNASEPPPPVRRILTEAAVRESQRMLSARAQLLKIGQLALAEEVRVVVLKGGVQAAKGTSIGDLVDVDLLVRPSTASELVNLLVESGYRTTERLPIEHHLPPLVLYDDVPVEIHTSLKPITSSLLEKMWRRVEPLGGQGKLWRLSAPDHLWYMLMHSGIQHPHRRGSIRDLLLLSEAFSNCTDSEVREVEQAMASHPERELLEPLFETVRQIQQSEPPKDRFREVAAAHYLFMGSILPAGAPRTWFLPLASLVFRHLDHAGGPGPWEEARRQMASPLPLLQTLERKVPRLGGWLKTGLRMGRLALLDPLARWIANVARSAVRRVEDE